MVTLTDVQQVVCQIEAVDAAGNPAPVADVTWGTSDPSILGVEAHPDGMGARVFALGPLGAAQVVVTADADLGEGVRQLQGILDVTVVAGEAVGLVVVPGAPEPQP